MSCQVVGTDPKYGFPRVCDEAPSIHIFEERLVEASVDRNQLNTTTLPLWEEDLGRKLIEIRGKCFNATMAVKKYKERCPWCPDPSNVTVIEQGTPEETSVFSPCVMSRLRGGIMLAGMVGGFVLAVYATLASIFTFVLVAFLRRKRRQIHVQPQDRPYATISCRSDPTRYEIPWEFTCRLPYWMPSSSKFEATTALQLEPSSSFAAPSTVIAPTLHTFRPGCSTPPTHIYQQIPDNPSIGPGHDSGLGFI
ncbi:hypothetical protein GCK32_014072 [Trichostrongylus colubriformis]|uniref:C2 domain-containing protein n=1 Tax=Trichostrongylus colubriformis TaxID=6319 RepID=A0AAN8ENJ0_TRICO